MLFTGREVSIGKNCRPLSWNGDVKKNTNHSVAGKGISTKVQLHNQPLSLRCSRFFSFPGGEIEQASEQSAPGVRKKMGRCGEGVSEKGGGGEKWNRPQPVPNILPNSVRPRTGSTSAF